MRASCSHQGPDAGVIPKVIHYCWFGDAPMPPLVRRCMASWARVMPDYELRRWDESSFEVSSVPFVSEAIRLRKWAFAADYVRLYALHREGGIYLDTDVMVMRRFDSFLGHDFFSSHEYHPVNFNISEQSKLDAECRPINQSEYITGLNILSAVMGAAKGNSFVADCLKFYDSSQLSFDGEINLRTLIIGPFISKVAERYGYRYHPSEQHLDGNMVIFEPNVFVGNSKFRTEHSFAIHLLTGSWTEKTFYERLKYHSQNFFPWLLPVFGLGERAARLISRLRRSKSLFKRLGRS